MSFNVDIYAAGSNARMFIGEHLTYLGGRYLTINVYPLSFKELKVFLPPLRDEGDYYNIFLESSFPGIVKESDPTLKAEIINDTFTTIFERDIILRGKVNRVSEFFAIARYVLSHIGAPISIKKIHDSMTSSQINIAYDTVQHYVDLMTKSYFLYPCYRYRVNGKEVLKTLNKFYVVDFGVRNQVIPEKNSNRDRLLENVVYLELKKHGYEVYTGLIGRNWEIDFVAIKGNDIKYIQVSESLIDPNTRERVTRPFTELTDQAERLIISLDTIIYNSNHYTHLNLFTFLENLEK